jgi:hypothetical protein
MLPKNKLGAELRNLNVVVGSEHKQGAQNLKQLITILSNGVIHKIGRRKAVARVYVSEGTG